MSENTLGHPFRIDTHNKNQTILSNFYGDDVLVIDRPNGDFEAIEHDLELVQFIIKASESEARKLGINFESTL